MSAGAKAVATGKKFENLVAPLLLNTQYDPHFQQRFENGKPWGTMCVLDVLIYDTISGDKIALSQKNQDSSGSVEDKIWWEMLLMSSLVARRYVDRAYICMLGNGWKPSLKEFVQSPHLKEFVPRLAYGMSWNEAPLEIINFDELNTRINKCTL